MEAHDYPIAHFAEMQKLTARLRSLPAQVLHHEYDYEAYGSWFIAVRYRWRVYRLSFDQKEGLYTLETSEDRKGPYRWKDVIWGQPADGDGNMPTEDFIEALRKAGARP